MDKNIMNTPREEFELDKDNRFIINNFQQHRPFSSFLPGIAGQMGIPLWVFYVNRGQAIASFGVADKDSPILEFYAANKAYQLTSYNGFRTFLKIASDSKNLFYEPFSPWSGNVPSSQVMSIDASEIELTDYRDECGLETKVVYFILPGENIAALVRQVTFTNRNEYPIHIECLDGLPNIVPFGADNKNLKEISRTLEAWMEVCNLENNLPFYSMRSSAEDTPEVDTYQAGNFALTFTQEIDGINKLPAIADPLIVFGQETSLSAPAQFQTHPLQSLFGHRQFAFGKSLCGFFGFTATLLPGESKTIYGLYGNSRDLNHLNQWSTEKLNEKFIQEKRSYSKKLVDGLCDAVHTKSSSRVFDAYSKQTFLDNNLRGGWPINFGDSQKPVIYHIYSRKHGDLERDYNAFYLAAECFSQGNGNFRDINQNRRNEVRFYPWVGDINIRYFFSLLQTDGYNPLVVKGSYFVVPPSRIASLLELVSKPEIVTEMLSKPFSPGSLLRQISELDIQLRIPELDFVTRALQLADQSFDAEYGEGFWTDHWTYNLDLIESYLAIFPDQQSALLFEKADLPYFESPDSVQPRSKKYVLVGNQVRQLGSTVKDVEKEDLITSRSESPNFMRVDNGQGEIYRTTLFEKMVTLALVKFSTLDPLGMGIEMEAGKPGWYDALNGLSGLIGSSMPETIVLADWIRFLLSISAPRLDDRLSLPTEVIQLLNDLLNSLETYRDSNESDRDFIFWDTSATARENYRNCTRFGFTGQTQIVPMKDLSEALSQFLTKIEEGISRSLEFLNGFPPTYFYYELTDYEKILDENGEPLVDSKNRPLIRPLSFKPIVLPPFMEGPMRMMKFHKDQGSARHLYHQVKESPLFDQNLKMYKVNASLQGQPMEIGRSRAFTPGWLENESIFLHMEYKYLLGVLRAGLYDEFFDDFYNAIIAFQDPAKYGRSPLENSTFLVSSAHPDSSLHGAGFVARLTGATAEFLSMWNIMMSGNQPFVMQDGQLCLNLQPVLPGWMFDEEGKLEFTFLGRTKITYHNPHHFNTYDPRVQIDQIELQLKNELVKISEKVIPEPYSTLVRSGEITQMNVRFSKLV